jgi:glycosyltransferase involved in cell wall biosynthesis
MTETKNTLRLAVVLWDGAVGGAEVHSVNLASQMHRMGAEVTIVLIGDSRPLDARIAAARIPFRSLGLRRGRDVLRHPRQYAAEVARAGPDGALLMTCGFMGAALRAGGYSGSIVAVEHGDLLMEKLQHQCRRAAWVAMRASGALADDVEVAVSDYILERMLSLPRASTRRRIYNGVDPARYVADTIPSATDKQQCTVAFAGRLVHGKGLNYLIRAVARLQRTQRLRLVVAGDGPERSRLEALAHALHLGSIVTFLGLTHDMPAFWGMCDIAVVPSAEFVEACPLTPLEAMACERPVIATLNGGIPEIVIDGVTGMLVRPGDVGALAEALKVYILDERLRRSHGAAGRTRVIERFHIVRCAGEYLDLLADLAPA